MEKSPNIPVQARFIWKDSSDEWSHELNDKFRVLWFKTGTASIVAGCGTKRLVANQMLCLNPGQEFSLCPDEEMTAYVISFSEDFLLMAGGQETNPFSFHAARRTTAFLTANIDRDMSGNFESIMKLATSDSGKGYFAMEIFKGVIQVLAGYFLRNRNLSDFPTQVLSVDEALFQRFINLLEAHYAKRKSVMEYASALAVTPNYLSEVVRRVSGSTPSFYIHQHIIREAKRAAHKPRASMKEVAYSVGFMDIAHFSKYFRNQTGMNFTEYRKLVGKSSILSTPPL